MTGRRHRVAFVKYGGLASGGSERRLQWMALHLPPDLYEVDFFWCHHAPFINVEPQVAAGMAAVHTDPLIKARMEESHVRLVQFEVAGIDVSTPDYRWVGTDFWDVFDPTRYELVQSVRAGVREYPYHEIPLPIVEVVGYNAGSDPSPNLAFSVHVSEWQRRQWLAHGGRIERSAVIPNAVSVPSVTGDLRDELDIPPGAVVAGFHQRVDDDIFSAIPLSAFSRIERDDWWFVVMGGSQHYRRQAADLGLDNVRFVDHTADDGRIGRFLATLDVFAHGRRDGETFGTVLAEAMAVGLPCLSHASATGNNAQLETMATGGLFTAEDPAEYAAALAGLLDDGDRRAAIGRAGRAHADRYYSAERCERDLALLYEHLLTEPDATFRGSVVPYGWSPVTRGLVAGRPEAGGVPGTILDDAAIDPGVAASIGHAARSLGRAVALGDRLGLWHLAAAAGADVTVVVDEPETADDSITLNGWHERVSTVAVTPPVADALVLVDTAEPVSADLRRAAVVVDASGARIEVRAAAPPLARDLHRVARSAVRAARVEAGRRFAGRVRRGVEARVRRRVGRR